MTTIWEPQIDDFVMLNREDIAHFVMYKVVSVLNKAGGPLLVCTHVGGEGHQISFWLSEVRPASDEEIAAFVARKIEQSNFKLPDNRGKFPREIKPTPAATAGKVAPR